jgi:hypothetical protein
MRAFTALVPSPHYFTYFQPSPPKSNPISIEKPGPPNTPLWFCRFFTLFFERSFDDLPLVARAGATIFTSNKSFH